MTPLRRPAWLCLIGFLLLAGCSGAPTTYDVSSRGPEIDVACQGATGEMAVWQCRQFYARQKINGYCLTVPGGDLGIWQCQQFYTRQTYPPPAADTSHPDLRVAGPPPSVERPPTTRAATIFAAKIGEQSAVVLEGTIQTGDDQEFIRLAGPLDNPLVFLASSGGNTAAALKIGRFLRLRGLATVVPEGRSCMSACGLIWLAGSTRFMGPTSKVGFHATYRVEDGRAIESGVGNALVGAYLDSLGLPERVVVYVTHSAPDEIQILTPADARALGIRVVALPARTAPPTD